MPNQQRKTRSAPSPVNRCVICNGLPAICGHSQTPPAPTTTNQQTVRTQEGWQRHATGCPYPWQECTCGREVAHE